MVVPSLSIAMETFQLFKHGHSHFFDSSANSSVHARQVMGDRWMMVTEKEVLAFIGFSTLMGINELPALTITGT